MTIDRDQPSGSTPGQVSACHRRRWTYAIVAAASVLALCVFRVPASPTAHAAALGPWQDARTAWDGVYTEEQAKRGGDVYVEECGYCHGEKLEGTEAAPTLFGGGFANVWNGRTVAELFSRISNTMPEDGPGRLSPEQYADIVARILQANDYPAGSTELSKDTAALRGIGLKEKPAGK